MAFHTLVPLATLFIFLLSQALGGPEGKHAEWYLALGLSQQGILKNYHLWQLVSHPFLHGNFSHWFTNAFFLYYFGGRIHHIYGEKEVWRTAGLATLTGGIFHLIFQGNGLLIGASGAGLGLFVALATISPDSRMFPLPMRAINLRDGILLSCLILLLMVPHLGVPVFSSLGLSITQRYPTEGWALFQIGHACHLGGGLAGMLAMRKYFRKPITLAQLQEDRARREEDENEAA